MYTIYCHTFPHGKVYVGLTKQKAEGRFKGGHGYKDCPAMNRAIQKYGWKSIDHDIIGTVDTLEEAEKLERYLIALMNSTDPRNGYNILPGGNVGGNAPSEETKRKIGNANRGKHCSMEHRKKISEAKKGLPSPRRGAKLSEETKQKMSMARKGRPTNNKNPLAKPVLQYTKEGEFVQRWQSSYDVELAGVTWSRNVRKSASGHPRYSTAGGFVWKYESDVEKVMDK